MLLCKFEIIFHNLIFKSFIFIYVQTSHIQIKSCDACQRQNHKLAKTSAALHPIRVEGEAWNQLGMDLVGPLHTTPRGNKYIMTITDYYTKWAEAEPLKDKTAASVSSVLYTVSVQWNVRVHFIMYLITKTAILSIRMSICDHQRSRQGVREQSHKCPVQENQHTSPYHFSISPSGIIIYTKLHINI